MQPTEPLPPLTRYVLKHEFGGLEHHFACLPQHVGLALLCLHDHGLTDVCREALAHGAQVRPEQPACYGFWTLTKVGVVG